MIDPGSETVAIATLAAVGFGFHTGIPLVASRWPGTPPETFQVDELQGRQPAAGDVALNYFKSALQSTTWLAILVTLSMPYILSALLAVVSMGNGWPGALASAKLPDPLDLARWTLDGGLGLTFLAWAGLLTLTAATGLRHWWVCVRVRSRKSQFKRFASKAASYFKRNPRPDDDTEVQAALEELKKAAKEAPDRVAPSGTKPQ